MRRAARLTLSVRSLDVSQCVTASETVGQGKITRSSEGEGCFPRVSHGEACEGRGNNIFRSLRTGWACWGWPVDEVASRAQRDAGSGFPSIHMALSYSWKCLKLPKEL